MAGTLNILLIEDSEDDARLIERALVKSGLAVRLHRVESEVELGRALVSGEWDLVLSDYVLPRWNALGALQYMVDRHIDIPFIIVSGRVHEDDVVQAMRLGAEHFVDKHDVKRLAVAIERSVLGASRRRENAAELERHREHLEELVLERTAEFEEANRRLREEVRAREQIEGALRDSEGKYRTLVESAVDGICIVQDECLQFANARLADVVGYAAADLIGKDVAGFLLPDDVERMRALYGRLVAGEPVAQSFETTIVAAHGVRRDVSITVSRVDYHGKPAAMVILHDITDQKRVAQILIDKERSDAFSTIAQGVAHNFTNIMSVISGYAASIVESFLPSTRPHAAATKILDATRHAAHLTQQLMSIAHQSEGGPSSRVKVVQLSKAVRDAHELVEHALMRRHVELSAPRLASMPAVLADSTQLLDTLMNVLLNAAEAMPDGGRVRVTTIERRIARPRANPDSPGGTYVGLCIRDSGVGMAREQVDRAFEPFFTTKEPGKGFGLGLSVAQSMVMGWGGWMDLSSRPGRGTRVRVFMLKAADVAPRKDRERPTLLVVDDNPGRLAVMAATLKRAGYGILSADGGARAIELYKAHADEIGLSIVDWIMPGTDGKAVVQEILGRDPSARIVVVSGFSRDYTRSNMRLGAWNFLQKPFADEELIACVEKALA